MGSFSTSNLSAHGVLVRNVLCIVGGGLRETQKVENPGFDPGTSRTLVCAGAVAKRAIYQLI